MSSIEVDDLITRAMIGLDVEEEVISTDLTGWAAIGRLHQIASREVLDAAIAVCAQTEPVRRRVGAAVLGQLGHTQPGFEPIFTEERYDALIRLLAAERGGPNQACVLNEACVALGHLHDPRAVPLLLELLNHPDDEVRAGVAFGLLGHNIPAAAGGLIVLSSDEDPHIRDLTTFGIAQLIDQDTPAIRAALHARLYDTVAGPRHEAIEGLARRGDPHVLPILIRELREGLDLPLLEAAIALGSPALCEALTGVTKRDLIVEDSHGPYDLTESWKGALEACGCQPPKASEYTSE